MRQDWIFEVLTDLRTFAQSNGMAALAAQMDIALRVARAELAEDEHGAASDDRPDDVGLRLHRH